MGIANRIKLWLPLAATVRPKIFWGLSSYRLIFTVADLTLLWIEPEFGLKLERKTHDYLKYNKV